MHSLIVILIVFMIIVLLGIFYWYTDYYYLVNVPKETNSKDSTNTTSSKTTTDDKLTKIEKLLGKESKTHVSILNNYSDGLLESRIVNLIMNKGNFYIYSNKSAYHNIQLSKDNRVSILKYIKEGKIHKQILLYGKLDVIKDIDDLILYKLNVDHRKVSITYENGPIQITDYSFDDKGERAIRTDLNNVSKVFSYIKDL